MQCMIVRHLARSSLPRYMQVRNSPGKSKMKQFLFATVFIILVFLSVADGSNRVQTLHAKSDSRKELKRVFDYESCSIYCGVWPIIEASSHLPPHKNIKYEPKNIHDGKFDSAWVEGAP